MPKTPPKLEFGWVSIDEGRDAGIEDLFTLEWEEIEHHKDVSPLVVDWPGYRELERLGQLRAGLLRRDGELIGYNLFLLNRPLHHKTTLWAVSDAIYVLPEHRRGWAGVRLIAAAEALLRAEGVKIVLYAEKPDRNLSPRRASASLGTLLLRRGYGAYEHSYTKVL